MTSVSLFIHSTGTTPQMWAGVPEEVTAGTVRLAPANLGYPPHAPLGPGDRCDAARDAAALLAALPEDASEVHLYAHSYGGAVALRLLPLLGARARSVFLYEPVLFGALSRDPTADAGARAEADFFAANPWFLEDPDRGGGDEWLHTFIDYWNRPGSFAAMPPAMQQFLRAVRFKMFQEVRSVFHDFTSYDQPALRGVHATVAVGARSPHASRAMAHALERHNPGVRVLDAGKTGHMGPLTHPPLVHAAMRAHRAAIKP